MKCRFCRKEIPEGQIKCPNCGASIEDGAEEMRNSEETAGGNTELPKLREDSRHDSRESEQQGRYWYGQQNGYQYSAPGQGNYGQSGGPFNGTPYMIFAIITTLLCCLPLGIIAIIYAGRINVYQRMGDYAGARDAANKARLFSIIGAVGGVIVTILYIIAFVLGVQGGSGSYAFPSSEEELREFIEGEFTDALENDIDDMDYDDADNEDEPTVEPAEQEDELGDDWDDYTVQINDKLITLPCRVEDLKMAGLTMAEEELPEDYVVTAREHVSVYFEDKKGNYIVADIVNMTDSKKPPEKCLVGGISVMDYSSSKGGLTVIFPGEIKLGTRKDTVLDRYGETDDFYEGDNVHTYTWYEEDAPHEKCEIEMDAQSRLVTGMSIQNYEF